MQLNKTDPNTSNTLDITQAEQVYEKQIIINDKVYEMG